MEALEQAKKSNTSVVMFSQQLKEYCRKSGRIADQSLE
jgi:hypothetical protein